MAGIDDIIEMMEYEERLEEKILYEDGCDHTIEEMDRLYDTELGLLDVFIKTNPDSYILEAGLTIYIVPEDREELGNYDLMEIGRGKGKRIKY